MNLINILSFSLFFVSESMLHCNQLLLYRLTSTIHIFVIIAKLTHSLLQSLVLKASVSVVSQNVSLFHLKSTKRLLSQALPFNQIFILLAQVLISLS